MRRAHARLSELERSPEARSRDRIDELRRLTEQSQEICRDAAGRARSAAARAGRAATTADQERMSSATELTGAVDATRRLGEDAAAHARAALQQLPPAVRPEPPVEAPRTVLEWAPVAVTYAEAVRSVARRQRSLVESVAQALDAQDEAGRITVAADDHLAREETRTEEAEGRLLDATRGADDAESQFAEAVGRWLASAPPSPEADPWPSVTTDVIERALEVSPESLVLGIRDDARVAAENAVDVVQQTRAAARQAGQVAAARSATLRTERTATAAESDPHPPEPVLGRSSRHGRAGAPLWRLVDVRPDVPDTTRAAIEAGLQASGLLDAWVGPDGRLLDADTADTAVLLTADEPTADVTSTLGDVLLPAVPPGANVPTRIVERLLRQVSLNVSSGLRGPAVDVQGRFRIGPLTGRASKPTGQFLGATARAEERLRRLAALDLDITTAEAELASSEQLQSRAAAYLAMVEQWVSAVPDGRGVLVARRLLTERTESRDRARVAVDGAAHQAALARAALSRLRAEAEQRAAAAGIEPAQPTVAAAIIELIALENAADTTAAAVRRLSLTARRWGDRAADAESAAAEQSQASAEAPAGSPTRR